MNTCCMLQSRSTTHRAPLFRRVCFEASTHSIRNQPKYFTRKPSRLQPPPPPVAHILSGPHAHRDQRFGGEIQKLTVFLVSATAMSNTRSLLPGALNQLSIHAAWGRPVKALLVSVQGLKGTISTQVRTPLTAPGEGARPIIHDECVLSHCVSPSGCSWPVLEHF